MSVRDIVSFYTIKVAKFMTRGSGHLERAYEKVARLGFIWSMLMAFLRSTGVDGIIYAPAKSKLVPVPLFMTTTERAVKQAFKPEPGDIVIDVGTYIGRFTLIASKLVGPTGKVIGVEPNPNNFAILKHNIQANHSTNVVLSCVAASNREGTVRLYLGESGGWTSAFRSSSGGWGSSFPLSDNYIDVPCTTLDHLLKKMGLTKVDWVKIDVEGAEVEVLEGCAQILQNSEKLKVIVEIHPVADKKKLMALFEQYGYEVRNLEPKATFPHFLASKKH